MNIPFRPTFAPSDDSEAEDEDGFLVEDRREYLRQSKSPERETAGEAHYTEEDIKDPRLQRLQRLQSTHDSDEETDRGPSRYQRTIVEPEIITTGPSIAVDSVNLGRIHLKTEEDSDDDDDEVGGALID